MNHVHTHTQRALPNNSCYPRHRRRVGWGASSNLQQTKNAPPDCDLARGCGAWRARGGRRQVALVAVSFPFQTGLCATVRWKTNPCGGRQNKPLICCVSLSVNFAYSGEKYLRGLLSETTVVQRKLSIIRWLVSYLYRCKNYENGSELWLFGYLSVCDLNQWFQAFLYCYRRPIYNDLHSPVCMYVIFSNKVTTIYEWWWRQQL